MTHATEIHPARAPEPVERADRFLRAAIACALGALLVAPVVFDPNGGEFGVDSALAAKRAVIQLCAFVGAALALTGIAVRGRMRVAVGAFDAAALAFVGLAAASTFYAVNSEDARRDALLLTAAAIAGWILRQDARESGSARALGAIVGGALLASVVDAGYLFARGDRITLEGAAKFASRLFPHQNVAALAYAAPAVIALAYAAHTGPRRARVLGGVAFVGLVFSLFLLGSKGALIGVLLGPLLFLGIERVADVITRSATPRRTGIIVGVLGAALGTIAVLLPRVPAVSAFLKETFNRAVDLFGLNYAAALMRPGIWKNTFAMFDDHPLLGVGLGNFQCVLPVYDRVMPLKPHAHNQFMQVLAELGAIGLVLFIALFAVALFAAASAAARAARSGDTAGRTAARAAGFALVVFALQSVFEPPLVFPFGALLFFAICGVATAPGALLRECSLAKSPVLRFAMIPAVVVCLALQWLPQSVTPIEQGESMRAGLALEAANDLTGARERYLHAAAIGFDHYVIHERLGAIDAKRRRYEPALAEYRRAADLFPNLWSLHLDSAMCFVELDRAQSALHALDRADALMPGRPETRFWRGRALLRANQLDEAVNVLEAYRESNAESTEVLRYCADSLYQRAVRDASLTDSATALARYSRYRELGGQQGDGWVKERIDQLGHWLREGRVLNDTATRVPKGNPESPEGSR